MITDKQTQRLPRGVALSAALLLMAAPAALADPQGYGFANPRPVASAAVNALPSVELDNPPKPDADFLSSTSTWDAQARSPRIALHSATLVDQAPGN
jgi:hypothetical protein